MKKKKKLPNVQERYAIYLRCSTDDQSHQEFSTIDAQRELGIEYVSSKGGFLVGEYVDEGISGTKLRRRGLNRLLDDAGKGKIDVVVCTYMSRLGRGDVYCIAEHLLNEEGVRVELVKEKFTDDAAGYFFKRSTSMVDGFYTFQVRGWTMTKMEQMFSQGYVCGNHPFGYKTVAVESTSGRAIDKEPPKRLVPDPIDAPIVKQAFEVFLLHQTVASVREYLRRVTVRNWSTDTAKYLLTNENYIGNYKFGEWRRENSHEPLIDLDTWEQTQRLLERQAASPCRVPQSDNYSYYLRGLVRCPYCGCHYTNSAAKGMLVRYYECLNDKKRKSKCPVGRINAEALHDAVLHEIERAAAHQTVMHRFIAESGGWQNPAVRQKAELKQLELKRKALQKQIDNLINAIAETGVVASLVLSLKQREEDMAKLVDVIEQLEKEIRETTIRRPTASEVQEFWSHFTELWSIASEGEKQELLRCIVQEVVVHAKEKVGLKLAAATDSQDRRFGITAKMGAGVGFEPTTFGL